MQSVNIDHKTFALYRCRLSGNEDTDSPEREQEPDAESTWRGPVGTQSATSIHPGGGSIVSSQGGGGEGGVKST